MIKKISYKDKEEWLALRRKLGIGGSEAGSVVGLNPYKSAYTLFMEKTEKIPEFEGNLTTEVGNYLEAFVATLFEKETGKKVKKINRMLVNSAYPYAFADVDRVVVGENSVLEIKTTNSFPAMKMFKNGEYPEQWYCQMIHYMAVGGYKKAYLAILIGCREFKIFTLDRDETEIAALMSQEEKFWDRVKNNNPPPADGHPTTTETITSIYPDSNEDSVNLFAYEDALNQYMAVQTQIKELEAIKDEMANKVKVFMGEAGKGETDSFRVSWTSSERKSFDAKAFAMDHANLDLSKYYKTSTVRTFKVNKKAN